MKTFLFDIDGTLLRTGGAGLQAIRSALREQFGVEKVASVEVRGRTDRGIVSDLFSAHEIADSQANWERFERAYLHYLPASLRELPGHLLPGVESALTALAQTSDNALGLLTGNSHLAARIKLSHFNLDQWFAFGGFGDHCTCRDDVARQAIRSAQAHLGNRFDANQIWVIGDTPLDVACGRAIGARTIGVLTGGFDRAAMRVASPDMLLDDLRDFSVLMASVA